MLHSPSIVRTPLVPQINENPRHPFTPIHPPLRTFETPYNRLLIAKGTANGHKTKILVDDAAEVNYIDEEFCCSSGVATRTTERFAEIANRNEQVLSETVDPIEIQVKGYTERLRFAVFPLKHKIILGKQWLASHRGKIDYFLNVVSILYRQRKHTSLANEPQDSELISLNAITNDHRKSCPLFAAFLRPTPETEAMKAEPMLDDVKRLLE